MTGSEIQSGKSNLGFGERSQVPKIPSAAEETVLKATDPRQHRDISFASKTRCTNRGPTSDGDFDNDVADNRFLSRDSLDHFTHSESKTLHFSGRYGTLKVTMDYTLACSNKEHSASELRETPLAKVRRFDVDGNEVERAVKDGHLLPNSMRRISGTLLSSIHDMMCMKENCTSISTSTFDMSGIHERSIVLVGNPPSPRSALLIDDHNSTSPEVSQHSQPLLRWAYEIRDCNIPLAERLEKSNWEAVPGKL